MLARETETGNPANWGDTTILALYEAYSFQIFNEISCTVPQQSLFYGSTNAP